MSNPYQTCPSQFYQQFRLARQQQLANQSQIPIIPQNPPAQQQRQVRKQPTQQQMPTNPRGKYVSQTLNSKDYQRMAKQAQMYQNNPRQIPVNHQLQRSQPNPQINAMNQVIFEQNPYVAPRNPYAQNSQMNQRRDMGRLQEIRNQVEALNAAVADICMRQDLEAEIDHPTNQRMGAIAPNPLSMKYGRNHPGNRMMQNQTFGGQPMMNPSFGQMNSNSRYNRYNQNGPNGFGQGRYYDTFDMNVDQFENDFDGGYDPYEIDNEFFSPSMSPPPYGDSFNQQDDFYDDWENEDYSIMQPIQMQNVQTMRPSAVRSVQPVYVQSIPSVQSVPTMVAVPNVQSIPMQKMTPMNMSQGGFTNPYRQKKQQQMQRPVQMQPVMQPVMQRPQNVRFQPSQQWQPVNSQFTYYNQM